MLEVLAKYVGRLQRALELQGSSPSKFELNPDVQPTFDVFNLVLTPRTARVSKDISAGVTTFFTVPAGKRWFIYTVWRAATIASLNLDVNKFDAVANARGNTELLAASTAEQVLYIGQLFEQGDSILFPQGNVADTAIAVTIQFVEYQI